MNFVRQVHHLGYVLITLPTQNKVSVFSMYIVIMITSLDRLTTAAAVYTVPL